MENSTPNAVDTAGAAIGVGTTAPTSPPTAENSIPPKSEMGMEAPDTTREDSPNTEATSNETSPPAKSLQDRFLGFLERHRSLDTVYKHGAKLEILSETRQIVELQQKIDSERKKLSDLGAERIGKEQTISKLLQDIERMKAETKIPLASNTFDTLIVAQVDSLRDVIAKISTEDEPKIAASIGQLEASLAERTSRRSDIAKGVSERYERALAPAREKIAELEQRKLTLDMALVAMEIDHEEKQESLSRFETYFENALKTLGDEAGWRESTLRSNKAIREQREKIREAYAQIVADKETLSARMRKNDSDLSKEREKLAPHDKKQRLFKRYENPSEPASTDSANDGNTSEEVSDTLPDTPDLTSPPETQSLESITTSTPEGPPKLREAILTWNNRIASTNNQFSSEEKRSLALQINDYIKALRGMHRSNHTAESTMPTQRFLKFTEAYLLHKRVPRKVITKAVLVFKKSSATK